MSNQQQEEEKGANTLKEIERGREWHRKKKHKDKQKV